MSVLTPAKIKAYLSLIKATYLNDSSPPNTLADHFLGILKVELLSRGVIVEDDTKVWSHVQSSVGKTPLVEQTAASRIPKALLAGANVVAGRVAESFHTSLTIFGSQNGDRHATERSNFELIQNLAPLEISEGARKRTEDLQDERWLFLLSPTLSSHGSKEIDFDFYSSGILQVALGYYSAAASIQPDTPQMWKKIWDVWSLTDTRLSEEDDDDNDNDPHSEYPPYEAQIAIENLIRIALAKNNTKRSSHLQLRLVQSYLNPKRKSLVKMSTILSRERERGIVSDSIAQSFGESFAKDLPTKHNIASVEKARSILEAYQSHYEKEMKTQGEKKSLVITDFESILYQSLQVESLLAEEDIKVQVEAQAMIKRSMVPTSLADCTVVSRESSILSSYNKSDKIFLEHATNMRDAMIAVWASAPTHLNGENQNDNIESIGESQKLKLCFQRVNQAILQLQKKAKILSRKISSDNTPWYELLQYIIPILKEMDRQIALANKTNDNLCISRTAVTMQWLNEVLGAERQQVAHRIMPASMETIKTVVSILPTILWTVLGDKDETIQTLHKELKMSVDLLSGLIKLHGTLELREQQKKAGVIASKERMARRMEWQDARASAMCFVCQGDNSTIHQITSDAITRSRMTTKAGFVAFLRCMVAWSGWFQNPWLYCTNLGDARRLLACAESDLCRPLTEIEGILLLLAKADVEFLNGGLVHRAYEQYTSVLDKLKSEQLSIENYSAVLLRAHCYNGIVRAQHATQEYTKCSDVEKSYSMESLEILESLDSIPADHTLWIWNIKSIFVASKAYQLNIARQLIANSLVHFGRFEAACSFLQKAVDDSPSDADAFLALGALMLKVSFYVGEERNEETINKSRVNLLRAAKLDPLKSDPFALLGMWYEATGDLGRAQGCFRKSLNLDPCNPIAGRGLLRLSTTSNHEDILDSAINQSSPLNGWAWNAVGLNKAYRDGDDGLAVVAFLKALRCQDIALPNKDNLTNFYHHPSSPHAFNEKSATLAEVGMSYRRLGRMTASIRAFRLSVESAEGSSIESSTLILCAQVEHELGLLDEALKKFATVIDRGESTTQSVALYGQATVLFSIAERELLDGKAGAALHCIRRALVNCDKSSMVSGCQFKLLGDLYSFGASLPPDVFRDNKSQNQDPDLYFQNQLDFVSKGEYAFRSSLDTRIAFPASDVKDTAIKSSILCDIASNILLQAQLLSSRWGNGEKTVNEYRRAAEAFRQSIENNPIHASSWCGLGCSVFKIDPLLAQHAFCRCIQIEKMFPDAYANVGFLYTSKLAFEVSKSTMEALTHIADTPSMWMNRAFILKGEAEMSLASDNGFKAEDFIRQSADAFRASLQLVRHPESQLGLSLTGRVLHSKDSKNSAPFPILFTQKRKDCYSFMNEYMGATLQKFGTASIFQDVMSLESSEIVRSNMNWKNENSTVGGELTNIDHVSEDFEVLLCDPSIRKIGVSTESLLRGIERKDSLFIGFRNERDLQRQIWCEPYRGDLWLLLAKLFIKKESIESARIASSRAAKMLSRKLFASSKTNDKALAFVDARIVSEAISLQVSLDAIQTTSVAQHGIQRALMMDPTNVIARHSLLSNAN